MKNDYEIRGTVTAIFFKRSDGTTVETLIDTADLYRIEALKGRVFADGNYARVFYDCHNYRCKTIGLHRLILNNPRGLMVDHINHNTLDNTRKNLRAVTPAQNAQNRKGAQRDSKSGVRGVYWNKNLKKWHAQISVHRKRIHLGFFENIEEAEKAAIEARKKYYDLPTKEKDVSV